MIKAAHLSMALTVLAALSYLRQSAAGQQEIVAERDRVAEAMNTLLDRRQYREAIPYARRVLELQGQITGDNNELYAADLHLLGRLYTLMSQSDRAEPLYRKAVTVQKQINGPDSLEYAAAQNRLGGVYDDMEFYDLAETHFRDALRIRESNLASDDPRYRESLSNLAWVDGKLGKYDEAERLLLKSLEIDKTDRARSEANYCLHVRNLAQVYYLQTKYERAEPLMREVIQIDDRLADEDLSGNPAAARIAAANQRVTDKDKLGLIYLYLGRYKEAETSLLQAEKEEHAANLETHYLSSLVETHLALLYQSEKHTKDALRELRTALEGQQKDIENGIYEIRAYAELIHYSLDGIVNVALETHDDTATRLAFDWTLRRKALGLDVGVAIARVLPWEDDRDISEKVDEIRELSRRIHALTFNPPEGVDPDEVRREVEVSRFTITRLQSLLDHEFTPAMRWPAVDVDTVKASLPPGSVLIDFLVVPRFDFKAHGDGKRWVPHYFAFVLSSDAGSKVRLIDIGDAHDIDRQVLRVREKIDDFTGLTEEKQAGTSRFERGGLVTCPSHPWRNAL
jgi:tetratricopeptide (TPR) repeat protein